MGPLEGLRVVEFAGIGPVPFCAMLLADLGADVIRVDRMGGGALEPFAGDPELELLNRGRRSIAIDLKHQDGRDVALRLVESADVLLEGFRPGVMERLGLGPDHCRAHNPRLVFGRMTGWGAEGPLAHTAGHDIDYLAVAGVLGLLGPPDTPPVPPLNLVGDYGGGGLYLALGVLAALHERARSGQGQVVEAAMIDGAASLTTVFHQLVAQRLWSRERGRNVLDGGAPFYAVYETADGRHLAVGALEPPFYAQLVEGLDLDGTTLPPQYDRDGWPELRSAFATAIATRTLAEWVERFAGTDACVAPVLRLDELADHPHHASRKTFIEIDGVVQPAPAPRFDRSHPAVPSAPVASGHDTGPVLRELGYADQEIDELVARSVIGMSAPRS